MLLSRQRNATPQSFFFMCLFMNGKSGIRHHIPFKQPFFFNYILLFLLLFFSFSAHLSHSGRQHFSKLFRSHRVRRKNRIIYIYISSSCAVNNTLDASDGYLIEMSVVWIPNPFRVLCRVLVSSSLQLLPAAFIINAFLFLKFCPTAPWRYFPSEDEGGGTEVHQVRAPARCSLDPRGRGRP